jgi:hypothetical protein
VGNAAVRAPSSAKAASHTRGHFRAKGIRFEATVMKGRVTCRTARKVLRAFMSGKGHKHGSGPEVNLTWTVYGWTCAHGTGGGGCIRHGSNYKNARDYIIAQQD